MTYNIVFQFEEAKEAQTFVIMLMQSGITELTIETQEDSTSKVIYEIDSWCVSPEDAITEDLVYLAKEGITPLAYFAY